MPYDLRLAIIEEGEPLYEKQPLFRTCVWHDDRHRDNMAVYADHVWCYACCTRMSAEEFARRYLPHGSADLAFTKILEHKTTYRSEKAKRSLAHLHSMAASSAVLLRSNPRALAYLESRGLYAETVTTYCLGHTGLCYVLPLMDLEGNVVSLRYRRDDALDPEGRHKYWGEQGYNDLRLYPHPVAPGARAVALTEGEFDALLLRAHGLPAFSLTNGSMGAARPEEVRALLMGLDRVVLVGDQDKQGRATTTQVFLALAQSVPSVVAMEWSPAQGKDVTAMWQQDSAVFHDRVARVFEALRGVYA
jgi:hypothetical protein